MAPLLDEESRYNYKLESGALVPLSEAEKDVYKRQNCACTRPSRSLATTTETTEPQTQTVSVTASPLADGRTMAFTTEETPDGVAQNWYKSVWLADTTEGL